MEQELAIILRRDGERSVKRAAWVRVLEACAASGLTVTEFSRRHGLCPKRLFRWRAKLSPAGPAPAPRLVELGCALEAEERRIEIRLGAARVLLPGGSSLVEALQAIREAAC